MCCVSCENCTASKRRENSHPSSSSDGSKRRFKLSDATGPDENFGHKSSL